MYTQFKLTASYSKAAEDKLLLDSLARYFDENSIFSGRDQKEQKPSRQKEHALFNFDPNKIDLQGLLLLGFEERIARRLIKYREAGGSFSIKSDLTKIYGLSDATYQQVYQYIQLPVTFDAGKNKKSFSSEEPLVPQKEIIEKPQLAFDINTADTSQLKQIYGIGEVLSVRIIKYRDLIGGFVKEDQLKEVYGLDEEVLSQLSQAVFISPEFEPQKININIADVSGLSRHPYIPPHLAKAIHAYRQQHGSFKLLEEIRNIHILDSVIYFQIKPYISL